MYRIEIWIDGVWRDSAEGPWDSYQDALDFAQAEVGAPWHIITMGEGYVVCNAHHERMAPGQDSFATYRGASEWIRTSGCDDLHIETANQEVNTDGT